MWAHSCLCVSFFAGVLHLPGQGIGIPTGVLNQHDRGYSFCMISVLCSKKGTEPVCPGITVVQEGLRRNINLGLH